MQTLLSRPAAPGLFRLFLSLVVFFSHTSRFNLGPTAVFVFFLLSGFWIYKMWTAKYSRATAPYFTYITSRVWRLMPVFLLCSAISWVALYARHAIPVIQDPLHQVISNLLIIGYHGLTFWPNTPAWSLDIELQFYLIAPLLIFLIVRSRTFFLLIAAISLCAGAVASVGMIDTTLTVMPYLVFFCLGIVVAQGTWRPGPRLAWCSLLAVPVFVAICLAGPLRPAIIGAVEVDAPMHAWNVPICVVVALILAPWAFYTTGQKASPTDAMFADLSYVVYMLHYPVIEMLNSGGGWTIRHLIEMVESIVIVAVGSLLIWRFIDHPINQVRARWVTARLTAGYRSEPGSARRERGAVLSSPTGS
jgi:peptidoglycan/LPS O-acetylase OafA/YrhL